MGKKKAYARANDVGSGSSSGRRQKGSSQQTRSSVGTLGGGVVVLNSRQYTQFEECMARPQKPTETLKAGARLLQHLRQKHRRGRDVE